MSKKERKKEGRKKERERNVSRHDDARRYQFSSRLSRSFLVIMPPLVSEGARARESSFARHESEHYGVNFHDEVELTRSTGMRRYYLDGRFIGLTITR